jgi:hypothetical protein
LALELSFALPFWLSFESLPSLALRFELAFESSTTAVSADWLACAELSSCPADTAVQALNMYVRIKTKERNMRELLFFMGVPPENMMIELHPNSRSGGKKVMGKKKASQIGRQKI